MASSISFIASSFLFKACNTCALVDSVANVLRPIKPSSIAVVTHVKAWSKATLFSTQN